MQLDELQAELAAIETSPTTSASLHHEQEPAWPAAELVTPQDPEDDYCDPQQYNRIPNTILANAMVAQRARDRDSSDSATRGPSSTSASPSGNSSDTAGAKKAKGYEVVQLAGGQSILVPSGASDATLRRVHSGDAAAREAASRSEASPPQTSPGVAGSKTAASSNQSSKQNSNQNSNNIGTRRAYESVVIPSIPPSEPAPRRPPKS